MNDERWGLCSGWGFGEGFTLMDRMGRIALVLERGTTESTEGTEAMGLERGTTNLH